MRVRIINGSYGLHDGRRVVTMTARSGAFEVDDAEAAALIAAGTAEPCESGDAFAVGGSRESEAGSRKSEVKSAEPTGSGGAAGGAPSDGGDIVTPAARECAPECYDELTAANLRELCNRRGIAYKKNASAKALRAALEKYDESAKALAGSIKEAVCCAAEIPRGVLDAEDGVMPELTAAEPVL